ncbi:MAG: T9SS type A sorting domain-containing protein [Chitinophagales bacterium]
MKRISLTLLAFFMIATGTIYAAETKNNVLNAKQVAGLDVSGKWVGKRKQYSWDKKTFIEVFEYEFDLKQEGNIVTGTSTIINANGEYADMKIEGVIIGNKLHFAEKEVKSAIRPEGKVWCFKSGELYFSKDGDNLRLVGSTPSYMEIYNYPCSGGLTDLVKVDNSNNAVAYKSDFDGSINVEEPFNISIFPNPFIDNATVSYNLVADSKVKVEVYDMTGKLITNLFEGSQKTGNYTLDFNAKAAGSMSGIFIVKMTINDEVYSRQIVQMR